MRGDASSLVSAVVRYGVLAGGAAFLAVLLILMAVRATYPFELEWMEGAMVDHVQRVSEGKPLYVAPSLDFVPFIYPAGYYVASAVASSVTGNGFLALRLVSCLSTLCVLALIGAFVRRETGRRDAAFLGAALFAAMYKIGGAWYDIGRVDMLALALLFAGTFLARYGTSRWTFVSVGLLLAASFLTKQSAAVMAAPVVLWMMAFRRKQGLSAALVAAVAAGATTLALDYWHEGWYRYFVFTLPSCYEIHINRIIKFFFIDLAPVAPLVGLSLVALFAGADRQSATFRLALAAGLVAGSVMSRANDGGYLNVLIPAYAALSLLGAVGFDALRRALASGDAASRQAAATWPALLLLAQFAVLVYHPLDQLPTAADEAAGWQLVEKLSDYPGDVRAAYHGFLASAAGKEPRAHWMAVSDILRHAPPHTRDPLARGISQAIDRQEFDAIVLSSVPFENFPSLDATYKRSAPAIDRPDVFHPVIGRRRPEWIYVPAEDGAPPPADTQQHFRVDDSAAILNESVAAAPSAPALCVDLDGTLVATDTLWESLMLFLKQRPAQAWRLPLWALKGKVYFKDAVARRVTLDPADLPYCPAVMGLLREAAAEGRDVLLVTAADRRIADGVAAHLNLFTHVIATEGTTNMAGAEKLRAIEAHLGGAPFDYAGDSLADLPVLKSARKAWLVRPKKSLARRVAVELPSAPVLAQAKVTPRVLLKALRVQQWVKNILLFVPLFAAHRMTDAAAFLAVSLGAVAFSLCASSIYIANDLLDLADDRANPAKRHRPFASGALAIPRGVALAAIPLPLGFLLAALFLPLPFTGYLAAYAVVASSYLFLKRFELIDVMILVALYELRLLAGGAAAAIPVSPWMLAFSMFLFVSLAFLKRYAELRLLREANLEPVKGRGYDNSDEDLLRTAGIASGYLSVLVLVLYINAPEVTRLYDRPQLLWLIAPCLLYWVTHAWLRAQRGKMHSDPIVFAVTDPSSLASGALTAAIVMAASL